MEYDFERLTWFTTYTIGGVLVGDFDARHILCFSVQPNSTVVLRADTSERRGIGSLQTNTCVVRAAEDAGRGDVLENTGIVDILDRVSIVAGSIT